MNIKQYNRPFLKKFLISYLVIFALPFLLNIITFKTSTDILKNYVDKSTESNITQIQYNLDQRFGFLENLVFQISLNRSLDSLSKQKRPVASDFHLNVLDAVKDINPFMMLKNNIATNYFIVLLNSRYVIDGSTIIPFEIFFKYNYKYSDWDEKDWVNYLTGAYHSASFLKSDTITSGTETFKGVPFVKSIPFYFNSSNTSFVLFNIKVKDLFSYYNSPNEQLTQSPSLLTSSSQLIAGSDTYSSEKNYIISATSENYNLIYQVSIPYKEIYAKLLFVKTVMIILNISIFIIGFAAAIYFAQLNANPLNSIYKMIEKNDPETEKATKSGFDYLNNSITKIIDNNKSMETVLEDHKKVISNEFYYKLIKYGFDSPIEIDSMYKYLDTPSTTGQFGIILLNIPSEYFEKQDADYSDVVKLKVAIIESLKSKCQFPEKLVDIDSFSIGYIFSVYSFNKEHWFSEAKREITTLHNHLKELTLPLYWTLGNPVEDIYNLNSSYRQAKLVADEIINDKKNNIYEFRNHSTALNDYDLPLETVQKIVNLAKSGDTEQAIKVFTVNWEENIDNTKLSQKCREVYFLEIRSILVRVLPTVAETQDFLNFHLKSSDDIYRTVIDSFKEAGDIVRNSKDSSNPELKEKLFLHLKENYSDKNLSLSSIAHDFDKSESYISHFFKKYCNVNFYTQLEKFRMEAACELLKNSELSIQDISSDVGYSSMHSFRRAFKKVYGISPSTFRKI